MKVFVSYSYVTKASHGFSNACMNIENNEGGSPVELSFPVIQDIEKILVRDNKELVAAVVINVIKLDA